MPRTEFPLKVGEDTAMSATPTMDRARLLDEHLSQASPDLMRSTLPSFIDTLMPAEADAVCGAEYGATGPERVNVRNGYRHSANRRTSTPAWARSTWPSPRCVSARTSRLAAERRRRAERALTTVVATAYLLGVWTRWMEKLVETLGITRLSKSQVGEVAKDLGAQVEAFRTRRLDSGPYTFVAADALVTEVREDGRVVDVHAMLAVGVNVDGHREAGLADLLGRGRRGLVGVLRRTSPPAA